MLYVDCFHNCIVRSLDKLGRMKSNWIAKNAKPKSVRGEKRRSDCSLNKENGNVLNANSASGKKGNYGSALKGRGPKQRNQPHEEVVYEESGVRVLRCAV